MSPAFDAASSPAWVARLWRCVCWAASATVVITAAAVSPLSASTMAR